jgi:hypothetical protein
MQSYDRILATCQQVYTAYLDIPSSPKDSAALFAEVEQMVLRLQAEIQIQSEAGINTVMLEKMEQDLIRIRQDLAGEN